MHEVPQVREKSLIARIGILIAVVVPFFATIMAIMLLWQRMVNWVDLTLLLVFYVLTALGITVGYHRMLTHRGFEPHPVIRFIFLALGCMAVEGDPLFWASTHIQHHAESDQDGDPHSPLHGFIHAHLGWLLSTFMPTPEIYGRWLLKDSMVMFFRWTFFLWVGLGLLIPYLIGGWSGFLWGGLVRIFLMHHVTWSVNSVCHTFGNREFATTDQSRNQWLVGFLAMGEGWHNNHHAFPRSAFHGLHWWQIDISAYVIILMERLGLVKNVYRIPQSVIESRSLYRQDSGTQEEAVPLSNNYAEF